MKNIYKPEQLNGTEVKNTNCENVSEQLKTTLTKTKRRKNFQITQ